jgi:hypothetical protein
MCPIHTHTHTHGDECYKPSHSEQQSCVKTHANIYYITIWLIVNIDANLFYIIIGTTNHYTATQLINTTYLLLSVQHVQQIMIYMLIKWTRMESTKDKVTLTTQTAGVASPTAGRIYTVNDLFVLDMLVVVILAIISYIYFLFW